MKYTVKLITLNMSTIINIVRYLIFSLRLIFMSKYTMYVTITNITIDTNNKRRARAKFDIILYHDIIIVIYLLLNILWFI
jgi:hypothetical protein